MEGTPACVSGKICPGDQVAVCRAPEAGRKTVEVGQLKLVAQLVEICAQAEDGEEESIWTERLFACFDSPVRSGVCLRIHVPIKHWVLIVKAGSKRPSQHAEQDMHGVHSMLF